MSRTRHFLYRAAVVRYLDSLLYEAGDARRSHIRIYHSIVHRLCGIGKNSFRSYLCRPEEQFAGYELPQDMKYLLQLYALLHKSLSAAERTRFLRESVRSLRSAAPSCGRSGQPEIGEQKAGLRKAGRQETRRPGAGRRKPCSRGPVNPRKDGRE